MCQKLYAFCVDDLKMKPPKPGSPELDKVPLANSPVRTTPSDARHEGGAKQAGDVTR